MPQYRVHFQGTVLVEADSEAQAEVTAGSWVRSMKQATHGIDVERPTTGKICALDLWTYQQPAEVSESFAAYLEKYQTDQPDELYQPNYRVGLQLNWELFERARRVGDKAGG